MLPFATIAITPEVTALISAGAPVAIGISGGKDGHAAALAVFDHLDAVGHTGPRVLIHADLGVVEWNASLDMCHKIAARLGAELMVVKRKAGDLMHRWERRWESSVERYTDLSTVTLVPCWSTPSMRFCTSELKTHVIIAELKRRFPGQVIINVTGIRRQESAARSKATVSRLDFDGRFMSWRPLVDWSVDDVFAIIDGRGMEPHPAYTEFGMSRVSCRFCIMSNTSDLKAAAAQPESHTLYRRMVALEAESGFAFQGARWLGDVSPEFLTEEGRIALAIGKDRAAKRVAAEKRLTKAMLFVKGWPTRMLTDEEADILADVRSIVCSLYGFKPSFVTRDDVHSRYAILLAARQLKED